MVYGNASEYFDRSLYPDLAASGGLAFAISNAAEGLGVHLGEVRASGDSPHERAVTAEIDSPRGLIELSIGARERLFFITCGGGHFVWTYGSTNDITVVVNAVAEWRSGVTLRQFLLKYRFMRYHPLSQAFEDGNPIEVQWGILLIGDDSLELLRAAGEQPTLRRLFPTLSHGSLLLLRDPSDRPDRAILIAPTGALYRVSIGEDESEDLPLHVAIDRAKFYLVKHGW